MKKEENPILRSRRFLDELSHCYRMFPAFMEQITTALQLRSEWTKKIDAIIAKFAKTKIAETICMSMDGWDIDSLGGIPVHSAASHIWYLRSGSILRLHIPFEADPQVRLELLPGDPIDIGEGFEERLISILQFNEVAEASAKA